MLWLCRPPWLRSPCVEEPLDVDAAGRRPARQAVTWPCPPSAAAAVDAGASAPGLWRCQPFLVPRGALRDAGSDVLRLQVLAVGAEEAWT